MSAQSQDPLSPKNFQTTHWSLVLSAQNKNPAVARKALAHLCQSYWFPLYSFVRKQGNNLNDSEDLVQGFFQNFLEKENIQHIDREKGRLRNFLLTCMKNYLHNQHKRSLAQKRGGKEKILSIDIPRAEEKYALYAGDEASPENIYQRSWTMTLLNDVLKQLEEEYRSKGKAELFESLKDSLTMSVAEPKPVEQNLNLSSEALRVARHRMRKRYQKLIRSAIATTLSDEEDLELELREMLGSLK